MKRENTEEVRSKIVPRTGDEIGEQFGHAGGVGASLDDARNAVELSSQIAFIPDPHYSSAGTNFNAAPFMQ
ncbi:MAG: hypothetical protein SynsKO_16510 [Synoicihabitans sp.]